MWPSSIVLKKKKKNGIHFNLRKKNYIKSIIRKPKGGPETVFLFIILVTENFVF